MEAVTKKDLKKASDQYCKTCKTKKTKYLGMILGTHAVMYKPNCDCSFNYNSVSSTDKDKKMFEHISTPFWQHMGLKPNKKEQAQLKYLKDHNMTWGDLRKEKYSKIPLTNEGVKRFQDHVNKYGRRNEPDADFKKRG